jgi:hypothetical protein
MTPSSRYRPAMTELPRSGTDPRPTLGGSTILLLVLIAVAGLAAWAGLGWQEIGLIVLALLLLTWPALAFYAWARRRGDL